MALYILIVINQRIFSECNIVPSHYKKLKKSFKFSINASVLFLNGPVKFDFLSKLNDKVLIFGMDTGEYLTIKYTSSSPRESGSSIPYLKKKNLHSSTNTFFLQLSRKLRFGQNILIKIVQNKILNQIDIIKLALDNTPLAQERREVGGVIWRDLRNNFIVLFICK